MYATRADLGGHGRTDREHRAHGMRSKSKIVRVYVLVRGAAAAMRRPSVGNKEILVSRRGGNGSATSVRDIALKPRVPVGCGYGLRSLQTAVAGYF